MDFPTQKPSTSLGSKLIFLFFLLLIAGACYASFQWAIEALIHERKVVQVPDLAGKQVAEALNQLSQIHLGLTKEGEQFDKRFPAGTIVHQTPPAGMSVREGRIVRIMVSQGGETMFVPDLLGQPIRNAQTSLQNVGLSIGEIEHHPSLRFEKDQVMASDPPSGAVVAKNALVNLVVSDGPPAGDVTLTPDFIGKQLADLKSWAATHQVTVSVREDNDITRAAGEVISQAPTADSPIHAGDTLTVVANTAAAGGQGQGPHIHFELPAGENDRDVRVLVIDESGQHEVFRHSQPPGSTIDLPVQVKGRAQAQIFLNGVMVQRQQLQ